MVVDRKKKQKALALLYLASTPLRNAANSQQCSSGVPTEFAAEPTTKMESLGKLNFSPEFFRLNFSPKLNFSPSTKKTTEYSFELFLSTNKIVFDFCCLSLFCYNAGHHSISQKTRDTAQGYIKCMPPQIDDPVVQMDGRKDVRLRDYYVTTKISWLDRLPNLLSNGVLLAPYARGLRYKFHFHFTNNTVCLTMWYKLFSLGFFGT